MFLNFPKKQQKIWQISAPESKVAVKSFKTPKRHSEINRPLMKQTDREYGGFSMKY